MEHIYDTVIIGGGPAGYSAALYTARAGLDTLIVEGAAPGGQMTVTERIDNYPGMDDGIDGFELGMRMQAGAERFGARTKYATVTAVELSGKIKKIATTSGELFARTVIIATGASPRALGLAGEESLNMRGVHYCAHCDGRFYKDKTVAVIGGANSAAEDALYLSRLAAKVYLVYRRAELRAEKIYRDAISGVDSIICIPEHAPAAYVSDDRLRGIRLKSLKDGGERELTVDAVFVSIGRRPVSDIFSGELMLDRDGYIIADETTKTGVPGVFAAGDVRTKRVRQVVTAAADGAVAAHFAHEYIFSGECD